MKDNVVDKKLCGIYSSKRMPNDNSHMDYLSISARLNVRDIKGTV